MDETPGQEQPWEAYGSSLSASAIRGLIGSQAVVRGGIKVKDHVQRFATDLENALGVSNFGTYNGHSPPEGPTQALDIFTPDNTSGYNLQDDICAFIIKHQKKYGARYCIRRTKIWNIERADEGWRQQGVTGNRTADHYDHVHVTFYASAAVSDPDTVPIIKKEDVMALSVRFIHDPADDPIGRVDWVFDGPSRIFAPVGVAGVLKAVDACKFPELGEVDAATYQWFKDAASMWGQNR